MSSAQVQEQFTSVFKLKPCGPNFSPVPNHLFKTHHKPREEGESGAAQHKLAN